MEFFSHVPELVIIQVARQATCNDQFNNQTLPGSILVTEYAVWSKKNQCIGQSSTFKVPKRNEH